MFGGQSDPSKTEEATPKRRDKQRGEGNVAKSQELPKFMSLVAGLVGLSSWLGIMTEEIKDLFRYFLKHSTEFTVTSESVYDLSMWVSVSIAKILMPILFFLLLVAFMTQRLQVGKLWTTKVFAFKWDRFNIIKALKQMFFSPQTFVRLIKSALLAVVVGIVPFMVIKGQFVHFLSMYYASPEGVAVYMLKTGATMVSWTLVPMAVIAAVDLWHARFSYNENLKMTKQEVKDEHKQSEGDPIVKQQQRQKMMEQMAKRMMQDVPKADVVITNPTHIAVALRYDVLEAPAPMVLAIGADHLAEKIKAIAREHNVPIRENVPLARALYKAVKVGDMIPQELFKATASILASIWRMKGKLPKR